MSSGDRQTVRAELRCSMIFAYHYGVSWFNVGRPGQMRGGG